MTQPNRPALRFSEGQQVNTNDERRGEVIEAQWTGDGEWTYLVLLDSATLSNIARFAEHELTEATR